MSDDIYETEFIDELITLSARVTQLWEMIAAGEKERKVLTLLFNARQPRWKKKTRNGRLSINFLANLSGYSRATVRDILYDFIVVDWVRKEPNGRYYTTDLGVESYRYNTSIIMQIALGQRVGFPDNMIAALADLKEELNNSDPKRYRIWADNLSTVRFDYLELTSKTVGNFQL